MAFLCAGVLSCGVEKSPNHWSPGSGLAAPSGLAAAVINSSTVNLSWTDDSKGETGYRVNHYSCESGAGYDCSCNMTGVTNIPADSREYTMTGLSPFSHNIVHVSAYLEPPGFHYLEGISFFMPHKAPVITSAAESGGTVTVEWSYNFMICHFYDANEGYLLEESSIAPDTGYSIVYDTSGQEYGDNSSTGTWSSSRTSGTYYYRVRARDVSLNYTPYSDVAEITVP